jgi:hypothetical protein
MPEPPRPSAAPLPGRDSAMESATGMITILIHDWAPGRSEIRMKASARCGAQPTECDGRAGPIRARLIADLDDALRELGGP